MPFWKKMFNKKQAVYYPRAIVQGKPVETETIARDLVDSDTLEWIELSPDTPDGDPGSGEGEAPSV